MLVPIECNVHSRTSHDELWQQIGSKYHLSQFPMLFQSERISQPNFTIVLWSLIAFDLQKLGQ
uniref:Uncharacterized protein n=1 Tax=Romanomermis culicivorax TaxID=13658 RepID=A0A915JVX3_ROMCU